MQNSASFSVKYRNAKAFSQGVTLIEVLVAVVILSIGLLGIAGLQVATAKYKIGSTARASTAALYSDYTDRVRMNSDMAGPNWVTGGTSAAITSSDIDSSKYTYQATWVVQQAVLDSALVSTTCDGTAVCTPTQRAEYDLLTWRKRVRESLPQGAAYTAGNRRTGIDVTLMWFDKENTDKSSKTDDGTTATAVGLIAAPTCEAVEAAGVNTGLALQTCCPQAAAAPAGVRCTRFSFMP